MRVQLFCLLLFAPIASALTPEELGKKLFFDKRLSKDQTVSCATCHKPELAFTNGTPLAKGVFHLTGDRNVPTILNRFGTGPQFWDMRAATLEDQVIQVMANPLEMGNDIEGALARINQDAKYQEAFRAIYGTKANVHNLAKAIAAYERTIFAPEAPFDRYLKGDLKAMSLEARHGKDLFFNKFKCASCHSGPNFSDEKLNVRCYPFVANLDAVPGPKFKTPTLRNLKFTGPYMHNGALKTLEETVDFYAPSVHLDANGKPVPGSGPIFVSAKERAQLVAFLKSLSGDKPYVERPSQNN